MLNNAGREILWNVHSAANIVLLYLFLAIALAIAAGGILRHAEFWLSGKPAPERQRHWPLRLLDLYTWGLFQQGVVRERVPAVAHTLIYVGFLVLLFTTSMVFVDFDLGFHIYNGRFYLAVTVLSDIFGLGVLLGCMLLAHRRYIEHADLVHNRGADSLMLYSLMLLIVQGYALEGLRIQATEDPWALYSPVGLLVSKFFWQLTPSGASMLHLLLWWFHTLTVYALIALAPYSKFFHIVASSANLFFRFTPRPKGALPYPGDLAQMMEGSDEFKVGISTIKDYTWKQLLDLDACTSCGRCQDVCPAYLSGKPLSPKWLILDTRNHALALHSQGQLAPSSLPSPLLKMDQLLTQNLFLPLSGVVAQESGKGYSSAGKYRGRNTLAQNSALLLGACAEQKIAGEVIEQNVFWSCTTCMACVQACPVGINHVDQIVENRRNLVLMEGTLPVEAQKTLRAIETRYNPYGAQEDRAKWADGLGVKILKAGDSTDYLYWVGCVSSFDPRKQKIARAMVKLMNAAGLDFGILGEAEGCSGDPARRLGEEILFQSLAKQNISTFHNIKFKTLVANCPHCFNIIRNEYPQLGDIGDGRPTEVIHHSQLIQRLIAAKKLTLNPSAAEKITFHDPCYLGRYNDEFDAPRQVLKAASKLPILEMERSREKGMCCGAGGGHFWMDLKIGQRVNALRTDQAADTGATKVATACPFCMQMLEDGVKITDREDKIEIKDIAEIVVEHLALAGEVLA